MNGLMGGSGTTELIAHHAGLPLGAHYAKSERNPHPSRSFLTSPWSEKETHFDMFVLIKEDIEASFHTIDPEIK